LIDSFYACVESALPQNCLPPFIPEPPKGKTYVIGAGKASAKMAQVFEQYYKGDYEGLVVTRYGHGVPTQKIKVIEASHPVPDEAGAKAAIELIDFISEADSDDLVICLLSGGGSALPSSPQAGLSLQKFIDITKTLLKSGASIQEINTVRKHLGRAFGGKLAKAAYPAKLITLSISDVTGNDPSVIASGPTVADPTTLEDTKHILNTYNIPLSPELESFLNNSENETLKDRDEALSNAEYHLIATPEKSLETAAEFFKGQNIPVHLISSTIEGDTNKAAQEQTALIKTIKEGRHKLSAPIALISGGETTVIVKGSGAGGPNTQFMLQSAIALKGLESVYGLACDTDGIDGSKDNAGAFIAPDTLKKSDVNAENYLHNNDSYHYFEALNDLIISGPTHTNVNDYRVFLLDKTT